MYKYGSMLSLKALVIIRVAQFVKQMETTSCIMQLFTGGLKQWKIITVQAQKVVVDWLTRGSDNKDLK